MRCSVRGWCWSRHVLVVYFVAPVPPSCMQMILSSRSSIHTLFCGTVMHLGRLSWQIRPWSSISVRGKGSRSVVMAKMTSFIRRDLTRRWRGGFLEAHIRMEELVDPCAAVTCITRRTNHLYAPRYSCSRKQLIVGLDIILPYDQMLFSTMYPA